MDILTHRGFGTASAKDYHEGTEPLIEVNLRPSGERIFTPRADAVPISRHAIIRIVNMPAPHGGTIGTMQFYENEAMAASALRHPRPQDESRIAVSRVAGGALKASPGIMLRRVVILTQWVDRWGPLETENDLTVRGAAARIRELEKGSAGTSGGFCSTVAIDFTNGRLLYMALWHMGGIFRRSYHDAFPE